jgi:hypothetical protein
VVRTYFFICAPRTGGQARPYNDGYGAHKAGLAESTDRADDGWQMSASNLISDAHTQKMVVELLHSPFQLLPSLFTNYQLFTKLRHECYQYW